MDLYRCPDDGRVWDIGAAGKRYVTSPDVVAAYATAHPERFDAHGALTSTVSRAALGAIPDVPGGLDPVAVAAALAPLLPRPSVVDTAAVASVAITSAATNGIVIVVEGILHNATGGGDLKFQFAQNTQTNDSGAIVRAGSYLFYAAA